MSEANVCEVTGFWIGFAGWLMVLLTAVVMAVPSNVGDRVVDWVQRTLKIPWYMQVLLPVVGVLLLMIGGHIYFLGNQGRYPGYPLDVLLRWWG